MYVTSSELQENANFLYKCYKIEKRNFVKNLIEKASDFQLNVLMKTIFSVLEGKIKIDRKSWAILKKKQKLKSLMETFDSEKSCAGLVSERRETKVYVLQMFSICLPFLLKNLFRKI